MNHAYNFAPGINLCSPEYFKHQFLLPKMKAKLIIQSLGHVLGLARELAVRTRQGGTDGRNSQHGRKPGL